MVSLASLEKVWDRYKELSLAENSKIGGLDISGEVLRETAKNIKTMKDIEKLITEHNRNKSNTQNFSYARNNISWSNSYKSF